MPAPKPSRKTFTINISIGLISIACDGFSGSQDSATSRSQYIPNIDKAGVTTLHPVGMSQYNKVTGSTIADKSEIVKCIESADGTLVPVSDDELASFLTESNIAAELVGFIDEAEYRRTYVEEKLYQIRPTTKIGGKSIKGESPYAKPFALFLDSMREEGVVGLVKYTQRSTTRYYAWHPDGTLRSLLYDEEVRETLPIPLVECSKQEIDMGKKLVKSLRLKKPPVLEDDTNNKIAQFVEQKAAAMAEGKEVVLAVKTDDEVQAPTQDLMALLAASIG